jgi:hypothetical protein
MVGAMMIANEVVGSVVSWMERVGAAGLILPSGWFGRPFDNAHQLTWAERRGNRVLLEFDSQLMLVMTNPTLVEASEDQLVISADQTVFDWQEYGSRVPHVETFGSGEVKLMKVWS